jgi:hypothetical protein
MLDYFRATFSKVDVKIKKADGIELWNVEIILLPLLRKVCYGHAEIVESTAYEMLLLVNLDFHNEPCAGGILAIDIKHRFAVELGFAKLLSVQYAHLFNGAFKPVGKESVEEEQKEFRASLVGEGFFESKVQSKRGEPWFFRNRHKPPYEKKSYKKNRHPAMGEYRKTIFTFTPNIGVHYENTTQ